jgi:hypothetical protein
VSFFGDWATLTGFSFHFLEKVLEVAEECATMVKLYLVL